MRARRAILTGAVAASGLFAATACGDNAPEPTRTTVTLKPSPGCREIEERKRLATDLPRLPYQLRNEDIANFNGDAVTCNERQIVFWGPPPASPDDRRRMIFVRFSFLAEPPSPAVLRTPTTARVVRRAGDRYAVSSDAGTAAVRFISGDTILTVTSGCVDPARPTDYLVAACAPAADDERAHERRALKAAVALNPQLDALTGG